MKTAVVIRNLTDLRAKPQFRSERKSQLLFGEILSVGNSRGDYCRVLQSDGYSGWADRRALLFVSRAKVEDYRKNLNCRIITKTAQVNAGEEHDDSFPSFLYYGTRLAATGTKSGRAAIEFPGLGQFLIPRRSLLSFAELRKRADKSGIVVSQARKFLGTPYLWGGTSSFGFDCSGLIQMVFRTAGVDLPRDSKDQRKAGLRISREVVRRGDLLFFTGHVALAIDQFRIIHSSLAEGGVAVNSLRLGDNRFRKDLYESFIDARRVLP